MKGPKRPLSKRLLVFIRENCRIGGGGPLLVGVSGGPDSVCLLHLLFELKDSLDIALHVVHLNHSLRGDESDADAEYVSQLADSLGIPATIERRNVSDYRKKHRCSLEEAAREVRYDFFAEVASDLGAAAVAVGHTSDDQLETILMHLIRGTGLSGLRGMQPLSTWRGPGGELRVIRPLLDISRSETGGYCTERGLAPCSDSSNLLPDRLRNRVRRELIPLLKEHNPKVDQALLRASAEASADLDYIDEAASRLWGNVAHSEAGRATIDPRAFSRLHPALQHHLIRQALGRLIGCLKDIESVHIEAILAALAGPAGKRLSLPGGLAFRRNYDLCTLGVDDDDEACPPPPLEGEYRLAVPGTTSIPGWLITTAIGGERSEGSGEMKAFLDFDLSGPELTVRGRRRGERFQPLGMDRQKKLHDFMVDAKIPRRRRDRVPLVCSPQHILWVVGWRIDHRARLTASTTNTLSIEFSKMPKGD
ncbi:tRNA lysidine(34) synthetase TilS [Chloroflexota bacterium]